MLQVPDLDFYVCNCSQIKRGLVGAELLSSLHGPQILAKKVYTLYSLAVQQLSRQDHYDFGLRALTSLLRYAGKKRRLQPDLSDEEVGQTRGPGTSVSIGTGLMVSSRQFSRLFLFLLQIEIFHPHPPTRPDPPLPQALPPLCF